MKTQKNLSIAASLLFGVAGCLFAAPTTAHAKSAAVSHEPTSKQKSEILALFDQWNKSLATGNPKAVAANYAHDSVLLPTVSNEVRATDAGRIDYFEHFLQKKPHGVINKDYIRIYGDIAINSGIYTFTFGDGSKVKARYTFVYQKQADGKWLIIEHHSSKMPE